MEVEQNNTNTRVAEGYMEAKMLHQAAERVGSGGCVVGAVLDPAQLAAWSVGWVEAILQAAEVVRSMPGGAEAVTAAIKEGYLVNETTNTIQTEGGGEVDVVSISFKSSPLANAFLKAGKVRQCGVYGVCVSLGRTVAHVYASSDAVSVR